jgi:uncharacterized SAM-binding protein YcdF (DUF218 family)
MVEFDRARIAFDAAMKPRTRWRARIALGAAMLAVAFIAGFGFFAGHISSLATPAAPEKADAIIVLTGGQARIDAAVALLKSGAGQRLLISGVNPLAGRDELSDMTGGDRQLFACCVDIDHAALDTVGNAEESAKWVTSHAYGRVILVTNNYHMPRSLLEMRRLIAGTELVPYPVVNTRPEGSSWLTEPEVLRVLFTEYMKYLAALARGVLPGSPAPTGPVLSASAG